jgi:hypothetical protein
VAVSRKLAADHRLRKLVAGPMDRPISGGDLRNGVEESRVVVDEHVAALELGDRRGVGDAEGAGSSLGPEGDRTPKARNQISARGAGRF